MSEHFFLDGYGVSYESSSSPEVMEELLETINKKYFGGTGNIVIIPYFDGKVKEDGGVSGIILDKNKHFTCHTFCYKKVLFVDYFGRHINFENVKKDVLKFYETDDYDLCEGEVDIDGNFGKHMIFKNLEALSFDGAKKLVAKILSDIEMTPINDMIIDYIDDIHYDILQPIAESHISVHRNGNKMVLDVFSCKWFDETKLSTLLNSFDYEKVCRGVKYK